MSDKRPNVMKAWRCTIREEWDDEPAYSVFVPPGTATEELERFLVENEYEDESQIGPHFFLDEQCDDPETTNPGDEDLILERDSEGKLRVKEE